MNISITVCARGGSKGVVGKNLREISGKKLIEYTLEQAKAVPGITVYGLSSDSNEMLSLGEKHGFFPIIRPAELATDSAAKVPAIRHCVLECEKKINALMDLCIDLDCTSPLRNVEDIVNVIEMMKSNQYANIITGSPARRSPYFNLLEKDLHTGRFGLAKIPVKPIVRRQDAPQCFDMNASIYGWKREVLIQENSLFLATTGFYEMPEDRSIDIDSELDFELVGYLLNKKQRSHESAR